MTTDLVSQFMDTLPPSSQNNSRAIVKTIYEKALQEGYGGYWTREFEELSGIPSDRTADDADGQYERGENVNFQ